MHPIIVSENLCKSVSSGAQKLDILRGVDIAVHPGETVSIVGASGSGKTTLLALLAGLDSPTSGRVVLDGAEISAMDEEARAAARASRVGFVFQSFQLLGGFTALENVMLPAELAGLRDARQRAEEALARVGLARRTGHYPHQLSGGEQQRVALARAWVTGPGILFADEPTGSLDGDTGGQIIELLFALNREAGTTLVLVTHDPQLAARCQRRMTLVDGRIAE
ncbi:ATP-binding cassette domain-containing protein [Algiphilus sp.]|uniref:ABC transporter ATP-binding protein n=1 Tax=Algiphilus sp. TaxID=1872431 RepID=UPI0025C50C27|nr:ATP-binding cassette domain-containing protein [Algiphilus sp.]MCK5770029.1 ATP-binding cassette domain-containing protein [Algiphilus sp.]